MLTSKVLVRHNAAEQFHQAVITRLVPQKFFYHIWVIERAQCRWNRWTKSLNPRSGEEHVASFEGTDDLISGLTCTEETYIRTLLWEEWQSKLRTFVHNLYCLALLLVEGTSVYTHLSDDTSHLPNCSTLFMKQHAQLWHTPKSSC